MNVNISWELEIPVWLKIFLVFYNGTRYTLCTLQLARYTLCTLQLARSLRYKSANGTLTLPVIWYRALWLPLPLDKEEGVIFRNKSFYMIRWSQQQIWNIAGVPWACSRKHFGSMWKVCLFLLKSTDWESIYGQISWGTILTKSYVIFLWWVTAPSWPWYLLKLHGAFFFC